MYTNSEIEMREGEKKKSASRVRYILTTVVAGWDGSNNNTHVKKQH